MKELKEKSITLMFVLLFSGIIMVACEEPKTSKGMLKHCMEMKVAKGYENLSKECVKLIEEDNPAIKDDLEESVSIPSDKE